MKLIERLAMIDNHYPVKIQEDTLFVFPAITASFVIPSFNSQESIPFVLDAIEKQHLISLIKEVIIIDDCSTDRTREIIELYSRNSKLNIVYLQNQPRKYTAYTRNRGVELATGDIVCFIDSDIVIPPNYLDYHLSLHSRHNNIISLSLRNFIDVRDLKQEISFPIRKFNNEFRIYKYIKEDWCNTDARKKFASSTVRLMEETNDLRELGSGRCHFWTLPEVCLGSSICYRKVDLVNVNGAPLNFVGWGFNDVVIAAKVIALGRYVVPIIECGVHHIIHPRRSGTNRDVEYRLNQIKYLKLLNLEEEVTRHAFIDAVQ